MSRLTEFYRGEAADSTGRTLEMIWAYGRDEWEDRHDFIQWLFPLRAPSRFNPDAPLLTDADVAEFRADAALQDNLRRSFHQFLAFLGLREDAGRVVRTGDFERYGIFDFPNHHWLRISRVLASTRLLGLEPECAAFFACLTQLRNEGRSEIIAESFRYWEAAASGVGGAGS